MSPAERALREYIHEHDISGHSHGWIFERKHSAEAAVLQEALRRIRAAEGVSAPENAPQSHIRRVGTWFGFV